MIAESCDVEMGSRLSHCTGWRAAPVEHWLNAVGAHPMYELSGGNITAEAYYLALVRPLRPADEQNMKYTTWCSKRAGRAEFCEQKAEAMKQGNGTLWIGMGDCVRSVMCDRDGGCASLNGVCHACHALSFNQGFYQRAERREGQTGASSSATTRADYMTRNELVAEREARYDQRKHEHRQARTERLQSELREKQVGIRANAAVREAQTMMRECCQLAAGALDVERERHKASIHAAIQAQMHAEGVAEHSEARARAAIESQMHAEGVATSNEASLQGMALANALLQEQLESERKARLEAEQGKRHAISTAEATRRRLEKQAADVQAKHEAAVLALHSALSEELCDLQAKHEVEMRATVAASNATLEQVERVAREQKWTLEDAALRLQAQQHAELEAKHEAEVVALKAVHAQAVATAEETHQVAQKPS